MAKFLCVTNESFTVIEERIDVEAIGRAMRALSKRNDQLSGSIPYLRYPQKAPHQLVADEPKHP